MPNRRYRKGARFEYYTMDHLRDGGYFVMRSYASKGAADLIAIAKARPNLFVQCKAGSSHFGPDEWNQLFELASEYGGYAVLATKAPRGLGVRYVRLLARRKSRQKTDGLMEFYNPFGQGQLL